MVRPYLNKSDHEEFLNHYKYTRNLRIRNYSLFFTLAITFLGIGSYYLFYDSSNNTPANFPAYLGGEQEESLAQIGPDFNGSQMIPVGQAFDSFSMENSELLVEDLAETIVKTTKPVNTHKKKKNKAKLLASSKKYPTTTSQGRSRGSEPSASEISRKSAANPTVVKNSNELATAKLDAEKSQDSGMKPNPELEPVIEKPVFSAEKMPKFPGGYFALKRYIKSRLQVPKELMDNKSAGTVQVQFIVDKKGKIINPRISKSMGSAYDATALALVKGMPNWIPGKIDGETVDVYYNLPIEFFDK